MSENNPSDETEQTLKKYSRMKPHEDFYNVWILALIFIIALGIYSQRTSQVTRSHPNAQLEKAEIYDIKKGSRDSDQLIESGN